MKSPANHFPAYFFSTVSALACLLFSVAASSAEISGEVVSHKNKPLQDAVIRIYGDTATPPPPGDTTVGQKDREFTPAITVIGPGGLVRFSNNDNVKHHVYSVSKTKSFEIPLFHGEDADPVEFPSSGIVRLGCNIHDSMAAYVIVSDTNLYGISDEQGRYVVSSLAPGDYTALVWHPLLKGDPREHTFSVTAETDSIDMGFVLKVKKAFKKRKRTDINYE